ncbi:MAG: LysM peptidoglycan-binding domain-containing protein, partial [Chloroflexota bacterium]
ALSGEAQIESLHQGGESQRVRVRSNGESVVQFRVYYFPGWRAYVDGQPAPSWPAGPQALITLAVPSGEHVVEIRFEDTNVRGVAKLVSLVSLLTTVGWVLQKDRRRKAADESQLPSVPRPPSPVIALIGVVSFVVWLTACGADTTPTPTSIALAPTPSDTPSPTTTSTPTMTPSATPAPTATVVTTPRPSVIQHTVQPNETLLAIALLYGTTVEAILKANNISDPRLLRAGQVLTIPLPTVTPTATSTATPDATQAALPPSPTPNIYVVQPNDVLSGIAAKFNIPVDDIMAANGMKDTFLRSGQSLVIPPPTPTPTLTPTPLPTSTSTPALAFSAPVLLYPPDGATFSDDQAIVLNWTAVGVLADDQYYALRAHKLDGSFSISIWLKTPSFRLTDNWRGAQIEWDVIVLQLTKTNDDGSREGKILSPFSQTRRFTWR